MLRYKVVLDSDAEQYNGHKHIDPSMEYHTLPELWDNRSNNLHVRNFTFYACTPPLDGNKELFVFELSVHLCMHACVCPGTGILRPACHRLLLRCLCLVTMSVVYSNVVCALLLFLFSTVLSAFRVIFRYRSYLLTRGMSKDLHILSQ